MAYKTGKYGVAFAEASKGWAGEEDKDKYTHLGAFNNVGVRFDTIEDAETLIHMVHLDELPNVWVIMESDNLDSYSNKYAKIHPLVQSIWAKEKSDRETDIAHKTALAIAINLQPSTKAYKTYANGTVIALKRQKVEYNPKRSNQLEVSISPEVTIPNGETFTLWLSSYITRDGKAQKSKFLNNEAHYFGGQSKEKVHYTRHGHYGENREDVYPKDMRDIADDLLNIRQAVTDWTRELYAL